jgi:hypothetical protein
MIITTLLHRELWALTYFLDRSTASQCVGQIEHWLTHHGPVATFTRLSAISMELLGGPRASLVRRPDNSPKGPLGRVYRLFQHGNRAERRACLRLLRIGGLFSATVTKAAYDDLTVRLAEPDRVVTYPFSLVPVPETRYMPPPPPMSGSSFSFVGSIPCSECNDFYSILYLAPNIWRRHASYLSKFMVLPGGLIPDKPIDIVGSVTLLTKDRKCKLRPVFNPGRIYQLALEPLYQSLLVLVSQYQEYTLDQPRGVDRAQELVTTYGLVSSIDLEAASDNVPLAPQLEMLNQLFPYHKDAISLFASLARAHWRHPYGQLKMCKGQPLGISVSFLSFSVFLMFIIRFYFVGQERFQNPRVKCPFCIVGDDIVTVDGHAVYACLSDYCRLSHSKTLLAAPYALFGGKIIDGNGSLEVYKLNHITYEQSPLDALRVWGIRALKRFSAVPEATIVLDSLPPPIGRGSTKGCLDWIPADVVLDLYQDKHPSLVTHQVREIYPPYFLECFEGSPLEGLDKEHPLYTALSSYEFPGTMRYAKPDVIVRLISESLNTLRSDIAYEKHAEVMAQLFGSNRGTIDLMFHLGDSGEKHSNTKPHKYLWSLWSRLRKYWRQRFTSKYQGAFMLSTTIITAVILTVPPLPQVPENLSAPDNLHDCLHFSPISHLGPYMKGYFFSLPITQVVSLVDKYQDCIALAGPCEHIPRLQQYKEIGKRWCWHNINARCIMDIYDVLPKPQVEPWDRHQQLMKYYSTDNLDRLVGCVDTLR